MQQTHEAFIQAVAAAAIARLPVADRTPFDHVKLVYGAGRNGLRGVTYYGKWGHSGCDHGQAAPFVEVCAFGQENYIQVAGTTLHELAHVLAGWKAGHTKDWKLAAARLGLRNAKQAGHRYHLAGFEPDIRHVIVSLPKPDDGEPVAQLPGMGNAKTSGLKPCTAGRGTQGGTYFKTQRNHLWHCSCEPPVKIRSARELDVTCNLCSSLFVAV